MKKIGKLIFLSKIIICTSFSAYSQDSHPDLKKLKTYRSYYHLQLESPSAHQFEVWYQFKGDKNFLEWNVFQLAAQAGDDTSSVSTKEYLSTNSLFLGSPQPPQNYTPVPKALESLAHGIERAVSKNHSDVEIKDIQVHYLGKAARLLVYELIPISVVPKAERSFAVQSVRFYFADLKSGKLKESGSGSSGIGLLSLDSHMGPRIIKPNWIDFILPSEIEGSSLLSFDLNPAPHPIYEKTRDQLMKKVLQTARSIENNSGAYDPSIEKVLRKQSNTFLPKEIKQFLEFQINIYGRTENFNDQYSGHINVLIPVSEQEFRVQEVDSKTGLKIVVTGDLTKPELVVSVTGPAGNTKSLTMEPYANSKFSLFKDGPRTVTNGPLNLESIGGRSISFAGRGNYTSFDIYPEGSIHPALITGKKSLVRTRCTQL